MELQRLWKARLTSVDVLVQNRSPPVPPCPPVLHSKQLSVVMSHPSTELKTWTELPKIILSVWPMYDLLTKKGQEVSPILLPATRGRSRSFVSTFRSSHVVHVYILYNLYFKKRSSKHAILFHLPTKTFIGFSKSIAN